MQNCYKWPFHFLFYFSEKNKYWRIYVSSAKQGSFLNIRWSLMRPNWPKLASLAHKTRHISAFQFCERVHWSQGSFFSGSVYFLWIIIIIIIINQRYLRISSDAVMIGALRVEMLPHQLYVMPFVLKCIRTCVSSEGSQQPAHYTAWSELPLSPLWTGVQGFWGGQRINI